ncbi:chemotaxis-specific protein-glutamate methyltransferase CheB [Trichocoleus sp. FACHB-90]|uniref:chemotaxis-specific protein-glutamate methyltransferase CheB n=1 Tax=Cyanophyceae TaxID=3028117 RepID=UPI00168765F6|nr:chemotaxis-specific protein-glutamate methyltransferase CheB [Trichocoleus sp. FACHB-90]MBD1925818.1 chemotaxis-specific protein-glutamate methyltransferase CheB [Trichocoleus sp. FACHB-90]
MAIKVLLVDDSPIAMTLLKRILAFSPEIQVVGTAGSGKEALALIPSCLPDVICTDLHMPQMDGLEFISEVMATYPKPILVISTSVQKEDKHNVFRLLEAGAVDIFPKPRGGNGSDYELVKQELIGKIKILSGVTVFTHYRKKPTIDTIVNNREAESSNIRYKAEPGNKKYSILNGQSKIRNPKDKIVTIGASTGGPQALYAILTQLPMNFPVPVICIQHISEGFLQGMVDWLAAECQMPIKIARAGEVPKPGTIYFPLERSHLEFDAQGRFLYSSSPPLGGHRPSVTVTFKSVASVYGQAAVGILLTGMGRDGAEGMQAIASAGGVTIAQDEASCVVFGMPKEAIALGAVQHILPITEIASMLARVISP